MQTFFQARQSLNNCLGRLAAALALVGAISGCGINDRAKPLSNTFLEDRDTTVKDKTLPFDHAWIKPGLPNDYYTKVYFRSVTTSKLPKGEYKASIGTYILTEEDFNKEADLLAKYFQQQLVDKATNYPKATVAVVDKAGPHTLVFDTAFTELEFSNPVTNTGALLVPIPGASILFSAISNPHQAFASRVYDGKTGELVATVGDRKFPPTRLLDLSKVMTTSPNREICQTWAQIIADALNRDTFDTEVSNRGLFAILPW